jgi:hypothetical protein
MRHCECSVKHVPNPVELVFEHGQWLCPTAAVNFQSLMSQWEYYGEEPPGYVTKHYGGYVRRLAREAHGVVG